MIPFSGFMPGAAGGAPAAVAKNAVAGSTGRASSPADGTVPSADDAAGSFLHWIQQLMHGDASATKTGGAAADLKDCGGKSEASAFERLQALIEKAMAHPSTGTPDDEAKKNKDLDALYSRIPPWMIQALLARTDAGKPVDKDIQQILRAIENATAPTQHSTAGGASPSETKGKPPASILPGVIAQAQPGKDQPAKGSHAQPEKDQTSKGAHAQPATAKTGTEPVAAALKAASGGVEATSTGNGHGAAKTSSVVAGVPKEAADGSATARLHGGAAHNKADGTAATVPVGAKPNASPGGAGDSADSGEHRQEDRPALKNLDADHLLKRHRQDSLKSASTDGTRPQTSFQDTVKSMPVDPSAHLSAKSTVGQATPLPRPDAPTANVYAPSVMDQIVDKATVRLDQGRSEVQIRLKPDFLGNVHMNIASDKNQLVVRIVTDQPMVKDIIQTHLHQLTSQLQNQGLVIHRFDVTVNPGAARHQHNDQFSQMFRQHSFQNDQRQPRQQNPQPWNHTGGKPSDDDPSGFEGVNYFA
jgi:flagellar hook-length control protein FliK